MPLKTKEVYVVVGVRHADYEEASHDILAVFESRENGRLYMKKLTAMGLGNVYGRIALDPVFLNPDVQGP